jgi:hypothetical protein
MKAPIIYAWATVTALALATTGYAQQNPPAGGGGGAAVVNPTGGPVQAPGEILRQRSSLQAQLDRRLQQAPRDVNGSDQKPADGFDFTGTGTGTGTVDDGSLNGSFGIGVGGGGIGATGTVVGSQLHGTADVVRSAGEFNRSTAQANLIQEHATNQALENREEAIDTYFRARELNREYRSDERGFKPTQADLVRYSQNALPARLPDYRLNRAIGAIRWPAVLSGPEFAAHRERLNELFKDRSYYNSGVASENYLQVQQASEDLLATLVDRVEGTDPAAYIDAKRFVQSLAHESSFVANPAGVAMK